MRFVSSTAHKRLGQAKAEHFSDKHYLPLRQITNYGNRCGHLYKFCLPWLMVLPSGTSWVWNHCSRSGLGRCSLFGTPAPLCRYGNVVPLALSLGLFQVGEFSFVLARVGLSTNSIDRELYSLVLNTAIINPGHSPPARRGSQNRAMEYRQDVRFSQANFSLSK